jgi:hypothetical protein
MFTLVIKTDNAAFGGNDDGYASEECRQEIARILQEVSSNVLAGDMCESVRDVNGNTVGSHTLDL